MMSNIPKTTYSIYCLKLSAHLDSLVKLYRWTMNVTSTNVNANPVNIPENKKALLPENLSMAPLNLLISG